MTDFSVIVPLYNCESTLGSLFEMLNNQQGDNFEVVFVEDKSSDNTLEVFEKNKHRIKFEYQIITNSVNSGPGISRNAGIKNASGKYITFLDSDDLFEDGTIDTLTRVIADNGYPDAVLFDYSMVYGRKTIKCDTIPNFREGFVSTDDAIMYSTGSMCCKVYKSEIIKNNCVRFPDMRTKEDFVFNKIALSHCETIYYKKMHLYDYIVNTNSVMNTTELRGKEVAKKAFEMIQTQMNPQYTGSLKILKIKEYFFGSLQSMLRLRESKKSIVGFIDEFEAEFPDWNEHVDKFGKYIRFFLYHAKRRNIFLLRVIMHVKYILKKILMI